MKRAYSTFVDNLCLDRGRAALVSFALCLAAIAIIAPESASAAACSNPDGVEGEIVYNTTYKVAQFCNGTDWIGMGLAGGGTDSDTLAGLGCASGQIPKWNGMAWGCAADGGSTAAGSSGDIQFNMAGALGADTGQLFWDSANNRLGIGTATPKIQIQVGATSGLLEVGNAPARTMLVNNAYWDGSVWKRMTANNGAPLLQLNTDNTTYFYRATDAGNTADSTITYTASMMIAADGRVGIGTGAPSARLAVVRGTDTWAADFFGLSTSNSVRIGTLGGVATIGANNNAGNAWADLSINPGGNTLFATTTGNVGIGTSAPSSQLHIRSTGGATFAMENGGSSGAIFRVTGGDGTLRFISGGTDVMRLMPDGSVGIGTTAPSQKLHVSGTAGDTYVRISTTSATHAAGVQLTAGTIANYGSILVHRASDNGLLLLNSENGPVVLGNNETEMMRIAGTGNVGIGTSNPGAKLDVAGAIKATQLFVNGAAPTAVIHATAGTGTTTIQGTNTGIGYGIYCNASTCGGASSWQNTSDLRLKERIVSLGDEAGLETVLRLRPVAFHWKDKNRDAIEGRKLGLIAQEVEAIVPEVVHTANDTDKTKSIAYGDLTPVLIKAVQELKSDNDNLRAQLKAANDYYEELRREIDALKAAR